MTISDLAYFAGAGVLIAATPLFVTSQLGSGKAGVGLAMGALSVATLLLRPIAGRWIDRHGRRGFLVGGAAMFAAVVLGHYPVTGLPGLICLRLILGVAGARYFVAGFAALADLAPPARAGEALSLNSLARYLGIATGPLLGQALLRWGGFNLVWAGAAALVALAAALATLVPETRPNRDADLSPPPFLYRGAIVPGLALFWEALNRAVAALEAAATLVNDGVIPDRFDPARWRAFSVTAPNDQPPIHGSRLSVCGGPDGLRCAACVHDCSLADGRPLARSECLRDD